MNIQGVIVGGIVVLALLFFIRRINAALNKNTPDCGCGCGKKCQARQSCKRL